MRRSGPVFVVATLALLLIGEAVSGAPIIRPTPMRPALPALQYGYNPYWGYHPGSTRFNYGYGYPYNWGGYGWGGYYGTSGFGYPSYNTTNNYYYQSPAPNYASGDTTQQSYYPPPAPPAPTPTTATIELYVPADAQVWFNGALTKQTGTRRVFHTPPLKADHESSYELRVQYTGADGKVVDQTRTVTVHQGQQQLLNLMPAK